MITRAAFQPQRLALALLLPLLTACNSDRGPVACPAYAYGGAAVVLTSVVTGEPISGATVEIVDGSNVIAMTELATTPAIYNYAAAAVGVYEVRAAAAGYAPRTASVSVAQISNACGTQVVGTVTLQLQPTGAPLGFLIDMDTGAVLGEIEPVIDGIDGR